MLTGGIPIAANFGGFYTLEDQSTFRSTVQKLREEAKQSYEDNPDLKAIIRRQLNGPDTPVDLPDLRMRGLIPERSINYRKLLDPKLAALHEDACSNGFVYCFRGDFPGLQSKGIHSTVIDELRVSLDRLLEICGPQELLSHFNFRPSNKLEEFMWIHSNGGNEAFISATASFEIARRHPNYDRDSGQVYVLKIPIDDAFRNYASVCTGPEGEILIPDSVNLHEIIEVLDPKGAPNYNIREFIR